jgi:threonine dehydratase
MLAISEIKKAAKLLEGKILRTPLVYSPTFSHLCGANVYLKLENLQETGSFKLRGASYKILKRRDEIGAKGVVAASAGNHAQGVALAARRAGFPATVVMPESASISKQEATRSYGGEVLLAGQSISESIQHAWQLAQEGRTLIHPFDDADIIAGQGTVGLELLSEPVKPDVVLVPIGGGGLISGIGTVFKALRPNARIIGVQAAACPSAKVSLALGRVTKVASERSLADGIVVKQVGELPLSIMAKTVDEVVLVEEEEISAAILMLIERKKILAEGAGAVPLAALLKGSVDFEKGSNVFLVISGGNVDSPLLGRVIRDGLFRNLRIIRFSVCIEDMPGALAELLSILARQKANVLHMHHHRSGRNLPVYVSRVEIELETRGSAHVNEVTAALEAAGYKMQLL